MVSVRDAGNPQLVVWKLPLDRDRSEIATNKGRMETRFLITILAYFVALFFCLPA